MAIVKVKGQAEFDAAITRGDTPDVIEGYIEVSAKVDFYASGSASVTAYGSASVTASGSASVTASDSASVTASGSASVTAYGSASVTASDSASVTAYGSASVRATGSVFVRLFRALSVRATAGVVILNHAKQPQKIDGGQVVKAETFKTPQEWCDYYGVEVKDGIAIVYKSLCVNFRSLHGTSYAPGTTPEAKDWDGGARECGGGLHFSPTPMMAEAFYRGSKWVACGIRLDEMAVHPDGEYPAKCKAKRVVTPCVEVDIHGRVIETKVAA